MGYLEWGFNKVLRLRGAGSAEVSEIVRNFARHKK
jgi:hypothetical protein